MSLTPEESKLDLQDLHRRLSATTKGKGGIYAKETKDEKEARKQKEAGIKAKKAQDRFNEVQKASSEGIGDGRNWYNASSLTRAQYLAKKFRGFAQASLDRVARANEANKKKAEEKGLRFSPVISEYDDALRMIVGSTLLPEGVTEDMDYKHAEPLLKKAGLFDDDGFLKMPMPDSYFGIENLPDVDMLLSKYENKIRNDKTFLKLTSDMKDGKHTYNIDFNAKYSSNMDVLKEGERNLNNDFNLKNSGTSPKKFKQQMESILSAEKKKEPSSDVLYGREAQGDLDKMLDQIYSGIQVPLDEKGTKTTTLDDFMRDKLSNLGYAGDLRGKIHGLIDAANKLGDGHPLRNKIGDLDYYRRLSSKGGEDITNDFKILPLVKRLVRDAIIESSPELQAKEIESNVLRRDDSIDAQSHAGPGETPKGYVDPTGKPKAYSNSAWFSHGTQTGGKDLGKSRNEIAGSKRTASQAYDPFTDPQYLMLSQSTMNDELIERLSKLVEGLREQYKNSNDPSVADKFNTFAQLQMRIQDMLNEDLDEPTSFENYLDKQIQASKDMYTSPFSTLDDKRRAVLNLGRLIGDQDMVRHYSEKGQDPLDMMDALLNGKDISYSKKDEEGNFTPWVSKSPYDRNTETFLNHLKAMNGIEEPAAEEPDEQSVTKMPVVQPEPQPEPQSAPESISVNGDKDASIDEETVKQFMVSVPSFADVMEAAFKRKADEAGPPQGTEFSVYTDPQRKIRMQLNDQPDFRPKKAEYAQDGTGPKTVPLSAKPKE